MPKPDLYDKLAFALGINRDAAKNIALRAVYNHDYFLEVGRMTGGEVAKTLIKLIQMEIIVTGTVDEAVNAEAAMIQNEIAVTHAKIMTMVINALTTYLNDLTVPFTITDIETVADASSFVIKTPDGPYLLSIAKYEERR